ncbi:MAG: cupin domain-containing protein [Dongiaceae bacterium]
MQPSHATPLIAPAGEGTILPVGPSTIVLRISGGADGAPSAIEYRVAPGFAAPSALHSHTRESWTAYVVEGRIAVRFVDRTVEVAAGGLLQVPPHCPFAWYNPSSEPARLICLYAPGGFERYFAEARQVLSDHPGVPVKDLTPHLMPLWDKYGMVRHDELGA